MKCFKCDKKIKSASSPEFIYDMPSGATVWYTKGNYGSAVYDPINLIDDGKSLMIFICDDCLTQNQRNVMKREAIISRTYKHESFNIKKYRREG